MAIPTVPPPTPRAALKGLLGRRYALSHERRLLHVDEDDLLDGFRHRPGRQAWIGEHAGKFLHAASLVCTATGDPRLREKIERVRDGLIATQEKDGYLGTYVRAKRFGTFEDADWDVWVHKYAILGLLADYARFGTQASLDAAQRAADLLIRTFFRPGGRDLHAAGQHVGMAATSVLEPIVLLHRATGLKRYLEFAHFIVENWKAPGGPDLLRALIAETPVHRIANAKAYEMLSNGVGLCELFRETKEADFLKAALWLFEDVAARRLYPTGGASAHERFQADGVFPCGAADEIAETCVTATWIQLSAQLLGLTGEARFAEEIERASFNHLLGAQRPDGAAWCYYTPLEGVKPYRSDTNCCLSSGPRALALLPSVAVTIHPPDEIHVNSFTFSEAHAWIGNTCIRLALQGDWPYDGRIAIDVEPDDGRAAEFTLAIRIPSSTEARRPMATPDGPMPAIPGEYARLRRTWRPGERVALDLALREDPIDGARYGRPGEVALRRGPLVLAHEEGAEAPVEFAQAGGGGAAIRTWMREDEAAAHC